MTSRKAAMPGLVRCGPFTGRRRTAAASMPRDSLQRVFDPIQALGGVVLLTLLGLSAWCEWQVVVWLASRLS